MSEIQTQSPLWQYDDVANYLGMSKAAVRNRVCRGEIPFIRVGARTVRFDPEQIVRWVNGSKRSPGPNSLRPRQAGAVTKEFKNHE